MEDAEILLFTLPIYSSILSVNAYGLYALFIASSTFVNGLANMGLTTEYERNIFEQKINTEQGRPVFFVVVFVIYSFTFFGLLVLLLQKQLSGWIFENRIYGKELFLLTSLFLFQL